MSTNPSLTPVQLLSRLADEQEHIRETWQHVIELEQSPPGSGVPWPGDRFPYAEAEMRARMGEPVQEDPTSPYAPYDTWLNARCGPGGYARAGDTVGIRDQASAEEFLRWIYPARADTKLGLARMISKVRPNTSDLDKALDTIGKDIVALLDSMKIADLADRIVVSLRQAEAETEREIIAEGAVWDETREAMRAIEFCD